jgi:hypothetical protein
MDRRQFLASSAALLAQGAVPEAQAAPECAEQALRPEPLSVQQQQYRIGYTTNTRGGWEGEPFKGMREARESGYR